MRNQLIHILFSRPATSLTPQATYHKKAQCSYHTIANRDLKPAIVRRTTMLWTITIILFILWIVGLVSSYTMGGWIHILLVLAIIVLIFNLMSGRRAL